MSETRPRVGGGRSAGSQRATYFNIHDRVGIEVASDAPTTAILRTMLAPFLVDDAVNADLRISGQYSAMGSPSHAEHAYRYTEDSLQLSATKVQIRRTSLGFELNGRRELLTSALPLIDRLGVNRGAAMIHAATFSCRGKGVAMPAWGGVGKTSTIAKLVRRDDVAFMGDDWAFISREQELLGYTKPMFIKPHHAPIYPHLFSGRRKPMIPSSLSHAFAELTTAVHPVVTRFPRVADFSRRWSPEHMMVTPEQALPSAAIAQSAPLALAVFVERFDGSAPVMEQRSTSWLVSRMIGNFHAELPEESRRVMTALAATGMMPAEQFFAEKAEVLRAGVEEIPSYLLRVPAAMSADLASDAIVEHLLEALVRSER